MLTEALRTGLFLRKTPLADGPGAPGCWLGGRPTLPPELQWPIYDGAGPERRVPMHFLAQIDLSKLPDFPDRPEMPHHGTLFFFLDPVFAPVFGYREGGSRVLYYPDDVSTFPEQAPPPGLPVDVAQYDACSFTYAGNPTREYRRWNFTFEPWQQYNERAFQDQAFIRAAFDRNYQSQLEMEARTASDRVEEEQRQDLRQSSHYQQNTMFLGARLDLGSAPDHLNGVDVRQEDFLCLLIVDHDGGADMGFCVGDYDTMKFYVPAKDLAEGDFSRVFMLGGGND